MELKKLLKVENDHLYLPVSLDIEGTIIHRYTTLLSTSSFRFDTEELRGYPINFFEFRTTNGKLIPRGSFSPTRAFHLCLSLEGINHFFPQENEDLLADREVALIDYIERAVKDTGLRGKREQFLWKEEQFRTWGVT